MSDQGGNDNIRRLIGDLYATKEEVSYPRTPRGTLSCDGNFLGLENSVVSMPDYEARESARQGLSGYSMDEIGAAEPDFERHHGCSIDSYTRSYRNWSPPERRSTILQRLALSTFFSSLCAGVTYVLVSAVGAQTIAEYSNAFEHPSATAMGLTGLVALVTLVANWKDTDRWD